MSSAGGNLRQAAVVLMSLPQDEAAKILAKLSPKQIEKISVEIARLGTVTAEEQENAIKAFASVNPSHLGFEAHGLEVAKGLVEKALGPNAEPTIENVRQQIEAVPFGFLNKIDSENLLTFIIDEHPQTIALILSHVKPAKAAAIVAALPPDKQLAVIRRIANMGQTNPEIISEVEQALEARMANLMNQQFEHAGGVEAVADILNVTGRGTERALLEKLAQDDPELADEIRRLMFVFEDIAKLSNKDVQAVLKNVETSQWAMALKGVRDEIKQVVLSNMSTRAAQLLLEEMEYLGPVKQSDVEAMQQQIVDVIRRLEDAGEITVHGADENETLIT